MFSCKLSFRNIKERKVNDYYYVDDLNEKKKQVFFLHFYPFFVTLQK